MPDLSLPTPPSGDDDVSEGDDYLSDLVEALKAQLAPIVVSPTRPTSSVGTPGISGRWHINTTTGMASLDTGTGWIELAPRQSAVQVGMLVDSLSTTEPAGGDYLFPDGRAIVKADYPEWTTKFGTVMGGPSGSLVYIPDLRGRIRVTADNLGTAAGAAGRLPNSNRAVGQSGGEERHALTVAEMPTHQHDTVTGGTPGSGVDALSPPHSTPAPSDVMTSGPKGDNNPHNNMQPYSVFTTLIRVR